MSFVVEAIAGAALSSLFDALLEKLKSTELFNFATEAQVRREIKKWEEMLNKLQIVLEDAEDKQMTDKLVKSWLLEIKHLAYDVEDILDEFSTECLLRKLKESQPTSSSRIRKFIPACRCPSRIRKFIPACGCFTSSTPWGFSFDHGEMMSKIRGINDRFEELLKEKEKFKLVENVCRTSRKERKQRESGSVPDETAVYGRDADKKEILKLLRYETDDAKVGVIPIVGMGGLGKTTLAKLVYDDDSIRDHHFQVKGWVCVSDVYDITRVTKGILESITQQSSDLKELSNVQLELKKQLAGKKFLLVLDDVWTEKYDDWHDLRPPMMVGAPGSKIIVTTRSAKVAKMMGTVASYDLQHISNDDCWLLFKKHAFENNAIVTDPQLENIGREIVNKRCGGLPLAARTLGGLLRLKESRHEWEEVLNNNLWDVSKERSNILPALEVSYYYLPSHLKRCFTYCAIIPKDFEFEREEIILLWMAEGLIPQGDGGKGMEDLGNEYYQDLLSRSIFQTSIIDKSRFVMHDLINDLAQKVAEDVCFRLEDKVDVGEVFKWGRVRYSSYIQNGLDGTKRFAPFRNMKCLRTFLPLRRERNYLHSVAGSVPCELVQNLKFVRVLSFCRYTIKKLPDSIGVLKHLRYLNLSYSDIEVLPETTTSLCNLQTLILKGCGKLSRLPVRMDNLIHLRHLNLVGVHLVEGIPSEIKQLRGLRSLPKVAIGKESFTIANLMNLKSLQGELSITNLDNVVDGSDALKARMNEKEGIHVLRLTWGNTEVDEVQYGVLDALRPHKNLSNLVVNGYAGANFPPWIANSMHSNIVHLRLEGCKKCVSLPQLGMLRSLKELFIEKMSSLQKVDRAFYGNNCPNPFPCLEVLWFEEMHNWEEWIVCEFEFRALRELGIRGCGKLVGDLPIHLPSLEKLVITGCENLVVSLPVLPKLSWLQISTCKELVFNCKDDFGSLTFIKLENLSSITNPMDGFLQKLKKFKTLHVYGPQTRESYGISNLECIFGRCPQLMSMVIDEDKEQLQMKLVESELESLTLVECGMPEKLPAWIEKLMLLKELTIDKWPNLVTIPQGTMYQSRCFEELKIIGCDSLISLGKRQLPSTLKKLRIEECKNLKSLLHEEDESETPSSSSINRQCLEELIVENCESVISLGRRQLPPTLKKLHIKWCINLKRLLDEEDEGETYSSSLTNLEDLEIQWCLSLTSISSRRELPATLKHLFIKGCTNLTYVLGRGKLPSGLQSLRIEYCEKIESIAEGFDSNSYLETLIIKECSSLKSLPEDLHNLINLCVLEVSYCPRIVSFSKVGLPTTSLTELTIGHLGKLEALPDNLHRLSSLQELYIFNCPNLVSFPGEGLPSNLTLLSISYLKNIKPLFEWGLDRLSSLRSLSVQGGDVEMRCFPSDETEIRLPPSLTFLSIEYFPNLEYLSTRCFRDLTSLQFLHIYNCPKLAFLPENGLPDSMLELLVRECPLLIQRCEEGKGPEWSKILHIPSLDFF